MLFRSYLHENEKIEGRSFKLSSGGHPCAALMDVDVVSIIIVAYLFGDSLTGVVLVSPFRLTSSKASWGFNWRKRLPLSMIILFLPLFLIIVADVMLVDVELLLPGLAAVLLLLHRECGSESANWWTDLLSTTCCCLKLWLRAKTPVWCMIRLH
jgi:hypothetical protein